MRGERARVRGELVRIFTTWYEFQFIIDHTVAAGAIYESAMQPNHKVKSRKQILIIVVVLPVLSQLLYGPKSCSHCDTYLMAMVAANYKKGIILERF